MTEITPKPRQADSSTIRELLAVCEAHRPTSIVESGTWPGKSASALYQWAMANHARFVTYEHQRDFAMEMQSMGLPCENAPPSFLGCDLAFIDGLDGSPTSRRALVQQFLRESNDHAICVLDDTGRHSQLFSELKRYNVTVVDTPRGLWIIRK